MNEQQIDILVKMRADIDKAIAQVKNELNGVGKSAEKSEKNLNQAFRSPVAPIRAFFRTISMYGFIFTATMGTMMKAVVDLGKTIDDLDKTAVGLGITTEELSKKIYGFNVATEQARTGTGIVNNLLQEAKNLWVELGSAIATATDKYALFEKQRAMDTGDKYKGFWGFVRRSSPIMQVFDAIKYPQKTSQEDAQRSLTEDVQLERTKTLEYYKINSDYVSQIKSLKGNELGAVITSLNAQKKIYIETYGAGSEIVQNFNEFYTLQIEKQQSAILGLKTFATNMQDAVKGVVGSMRGSLSSFFNDAFTGQLKKASDYFTEFGKGLIKTFSDVISEIITRMMILKTVQALGGTGDNWGRWFGIASKAVSVASFHQGGMIYAHQGINLKSDEVPIIAQTGERVLSRNQNKEYESGGKNVNYYIYAVDAKSFAEMLYQNRASVNAITTQALKNNSSLRGSVRSA